MKIVKSFKKKLIVDCRFENLYVDVDFAQIFVVDCRPMSKNIVESTERLTPPGPPLYSCHHLCTSSATEVSFELSLYV